MHPLLSKVLYLVVGLLLFYAFLRWFERANLYFPSRSHDLLPTAAGLPFEEVGFKTADGVRLSAWYSDVSEPARGPQGVEPELRGVVPLKSGPDGPLVVLHFHGNAGNISHRLPKLRIFRGIGMSALLVDYRGYGKSKGRPSEKGTYLDGEAAADYLVREKGVPLERIVYLGTSLGGAVALETALRRPPRALILESAFTSTADMGRILLPFLPVKLLVRHKYDNIGKIPRLKTPVLVLHSPEDDIIPFEMGRRLFEAAPEPKSFAELSGDHNEGFLAGPAYAAAIRDFLEELGGKPHEAKP